jgi:SNF2 family DNA or RNA helicase
MGQEAESINVYYLVAQKTIESEICGLLDEKRKVLTSILDGDTVAQESILTELLLRYR